MKEEMPLEVKMRIDGVLYDQVITDDIKEGDRVFDTKDWTHGICDMRKGDTIAIGDGGFAELGIPISRVRKLVPTPEQDQITEP